MPPGDLPRSTLSRLRAGDPRALEATYRLFGPRIYRLCLGMLRHAHDAEDATQEVFLRLLERARQFDGRSRFSTWLHRLAVNHCLHRLERDQTRRAGELDETLGDRARSPLDAAQGNETLQLATALLARVAPHHRAVLVLREVEGLSYAEIAEVLGVPVGTVMSRLARGRERLAALVSKPPKSGERTLPPTRSAS